MKWWMFGEECVLQFHLFVGQAHPTNMIWWRLINFDFFLDIWVVNKGIGALDTILGSCWSNYLNSIVKSYGNEMQQNVSSKKTWE